jgi:hypothetical protein
MLSPGTMFNRPQGKHQVGKEKIEAKSFKTIKPGAFWPNFSEIPTMICL